MATAVRAEPCSSVLAGRRRVPRAGDGLRQGAVAQWSHSLPLVAEKFLKQTLPGTRPEDPFTDRRLVSEPAARAGFPWGGGHHWPHGPTLGYVRRLRQRSTRRDGLGRLVGPGTQQGGFRAVTAAGRAPVCVKRLDGSAACAPIIGGFSPPRLHAGGVSPPQSGTADLRGFRAVYFFPPVRCGQQ
jgi:hypothetical protein